jgi:hypothetical protein
MIDLLEQHDGVIYKKHSYPHTAEYHQDARLS